MNTFSKIVMLGAFALFISGCGHQSPEPKTDPGVLPAKEAGVGISYFNKVSAEKSTPDNRGTCAALVPLNVDAANTEAVFKDTAFGFEALLPYNEKWGTADKRLAAFETDEYHNNVINFGPAIQFGEGDCLYGRAYRITKVQKRDQAMMVQDLLIDHTIESESDITTFADEMYQGKKVMKYTIAGLCENNHYEVIGEKNNLVVSTFCDNNPEHDLILQSVVASMKF